MAIRKDGIKSRENLLRAAAEVFAEKGYQKATVAQICQKAGSNIASVNYHFTSKDELYIAVWKKAFEHALQVYPADGGLDQTATPPQRLGALIHCLLHRILDDGTLGFAGQILLRELGEPTEVIGNIMLDVVAPLRKLARNILSELLGPAANERNLRFCELSIVHQCLATSFRRSRKNFPRVFEDEITIEIIDELAEHITLFSLAGISAVRKKWKNMKQKKKADR
ncbi:MAG: CerR family C-terminal domain-containing protein [Anaerohalosphaeraceae bacterium]|nr:CerR family C-terminal domain-containing protein [Anaerohalosphaeraceae bacterium]